MPELKTKATEASVDHFIARIADPRQRADASKVADIMKEVTGSPPRMWGTSIVGFGTYHYRYASGHEGDAPLASFAPRAAHLVVYLTGGYADRYARLLPGLGPHRTGKSCLYVKRLADVDLDNAADCLVKFKSNRYFGWILVAGLFADLLLAR